MGNLKSRISSQGGRGHWAVYNTSTPNFYCNVFLFVDSTTFGNLLIGWFIKLVVGFIKLGNANQFIGHCLIPLNPFAHCFLSQLRKPYLVTVEIPPPPLAF